jgi:predicted nucleotidyltransferase/DNA-binding transcriptional regulator YiaG
VACPRGWFVPGDMRPCTKRYNIRYMPDPAKAIVQARRAAGLTQAELASRSHTSQPAVNRYESGRVKPRPETLRRLIESCRTAPPRPSDVLKAHRDEILAFARRHGASSVLLFGSVARDEDDSDSDIDLLMDIPPTYGLLAMARMQRELSELLGMPVDLGSVDDLRPRIREQVLAGARPL